RQGCADRRGAAADAQDGGQSRGLADGGVRPDTRRRPRRSLAVLQGSQCAVLRRQPPGRQGLARLTGLVLAPRHAGRSQRCLRLHRGLLRDGLHPGPRAVRRADPHHPWRRRPDRPDRRLRPAFLQADQERTSRGLQGRAARAVLDPQGPGQRRPALILRRLSRARSDRDARHLAGRQEPRAGRRRTMAETRRVKKVWKSKPTIEGAGVHLRRAFGFREVPQLDPFLLLDDFRSNEPAEYQRGFPWHPHRGMETITYVLAGDVEHGDSLGNRGVIRAGDVQWMTAGSGIIHQEMPKGDSQGRMWGFQLWANLPARHKMMDPRYQEVKHDDIPVVETADGARVRVISGEVAGVRGPVREIVTDPEYLDVSLPPGRTFTHAAKPTHTVFAYVIEGEG